MFRGIKLVMQVLRPRGCVLTCPQALPVRGLPVAVHRGLRWAAGKGASALEVNLRQGDRSSPKDATLGLQDPGCWE